METFFHTNSALSTESGQWGYKITDITEGQYGGRRKQEVLHNIGGLNQGEYITESEKQQYGSGLFASDIAGENIQASSCVYNISPLRCNLCKNNYRGCL